jgi:hypothetical protein
LQRNEAHMLVQAQKNGKTGGVTSHVNQDRTGTTTQKGGAERPGAKGRGRKEGLVDK